MTTHPLLRLDFYEDSIILHKLADMLQTDSAQSRPPEGHQSYPIALDDLIAALSQVQIRSGWLPKNCLFWHRQNGAEQLGIYVPARRWRLQTAQRTYHVPLPKMLFMGAGTTYKAFALKQRPTPPECPLYHLPCPNVHADGRICTGNAPFPIATSATIEQALHLFLEGSLFNKDLNAGKCQSHSKNVIKLWRKLEKAKRFPLKELVPTHISFN